MNSEKLIDYGKRWALLALGMFVAASGISLITRTHLGTTPISSLPYTIIGVREGTFVSALCVGLFAKQFLKLWPMPKAPEPRVAEEKAMAGSENRLKPRP